MALGEIRLTTTRFIAGILIASSVGAIAATAARHRDRTVTVDVGAMDPAVSPDGSTIAVSILGRIFLVPIDGGEGRQISLGGGWDASPSWDPSGRALAYRHDEAVGSEIVLHNLDRGVSRTVYAKGSRWGRSARELGRIAFHPTKPEILFVGYYSAEGLWSVTLTGDSATHLIKDDPRSGGLGVWATFSPSPNGRAVAVTRSVGGSYASAIYTTPLDKIALTLVAAGENLRTVRDGKPFVYQDVEHYSPQWTRDSIPRLVYIERANGFESVVIQDVATKATKRFKLGAYGGRQLALLPDGKSAVLASERKLYRLNLETGKTSPIEFNASFAIADPKPDDLVITNARLFDATDSVAKDSATVEIDDGRIAKISFGKPVKSKRGKRVIDARGRFLMPGLTDSHDHHWVASFPFYQQTLAQGITTVLDLGSEPIETLNHRDMIRLGLMDGPQVYTVGRMLNGSGGAGDNTLVVTTEDAAEEVVKAYKRMGIDAIKIYARQTDVVAAAAIARAHDNPRIPVTGDLTRMGWPEAVTADIDGVVHLLNYKWGFLSKEQREGDYGAVTNLWPEPDSAEVDALFDRMSKKGFTIDPTIMVSLCRRCPMEQMLASRSELFRNPSGISDPTDARLVRILSRLMRQATRKGIPMVVGTDAGDFKMYLDNLEALEAVGIPNATILRAATANLAKWLGKEQEFGTIEVGRRADLILVGGDPLERISDLASIQLVVKDGRIVIETAR